jgi:hypothetical protein
VVTIMGSMGSIIVSKHAADKRRELDAARATAERLPAELKERRVELERVSSLDERLRAEIASLDERRAEMEVRPCRDRRAHDFPAHARTHHAHAHTTQARADPIALRCRFTLAVEAAAP